MTTGSGFWLAPTEGSLFKIVAIIRQLMEGRSNASGSLTLAANATTTTVTALACGPTSAVFLFAQTANAAAAGAYVAPANVTAKQFIVSHPSAATVDRTFYFVCLG